MGVTPETLGCEVGLTVGRSVSWGGRGCNVKNKKKRECRKRDGQIVEQRMGKIEIDWGETWPLIEGTDQ